MAIKAVKIKYKLCLILIISLIFIYSCSQNLCPAYTGHGDRGNDKLPKELRK